jgi:hypothetical protein
MAISKKATDAAIEILQIDQGKAEFCIVGTTPTITSRMSGKAWRELFMPKTKTKSERQGTLKHQPFQEFWDSPYTLREENAPTFIACLGSQFKGMLCGAALDMPGVAKTQIKRLVTVSGNRLPLYGLPQMFCSIVRSSDMNKTPDVRTRLIIPEWAARVTVTFTKPALNAKSIANLMSAAGFTQGLGEWRPEKGSGDYGQFKIVAPTDADFKRITKMGRKQQIQAMLNPEYYDDETEDLMAWAAEEAENRGIKLIMPVDEAKKRGLTTLGRVAA